MMETLTTTRYPSLPLRAENDSLGRSLRVCVVSSDIVGPVRNGGVGTAFTALAFALADAGHDVTVLYVGGTFCENGKLSDWVTYYADRNICLVPLPTPDGPALNASWPVARAYATYEWLKANDRFDVIHTCEWQGNSYFALLARRQGLAFCNTLFCMTTHGPSFWHRESNGNFIEHIADLELNHIEKQSVAWADMLLAPSHYLLNWMTTHDWVLPEKTYVQQYVMPHLARLASNRSFDQPMPVRELVFFGRLETRKGLVLLCNALDRLVDRHELRGIKLTFLGKIDAIDGESADHYIEQRAAKWPWVPRLITDQDQAGVMQYLSEPGRLALIPSLSDNLPNTVLECLAARIPFIAADAGGIPEMIHPDDLADVCFKPRPDVFAERLMKVVAHGMRPARFAVDPQINEHQWVIWHSQIDLRLAVLAPVRPEMVATPPLVSVCMPHRNRTEYLRQSLASIAEQDYPNIEVIIVDDGSDQPEALRYLKQLETEHIGKRWQIIRQENQFPGAARNNAVRHAHGEWIFFMDDDNYAKPNEVSSLVHAAANSGADILTCFSDVIKHRDRPKVDEKGEMRWLFLGAAAGPGAFRNVFGDTNSLFRREVFEQLGGFHEEYGVGYEDWELFAKASLAGYRMEVVPEVLFYYRALSEGVNTNTSMHANMLRVAKPYIDSAPSSMRELLMFAQGVCLRADSQPKVNAEPTRLQSLLTAGSALFESKENDAAWRVYAIAMRYAREARDGVATVECLIGSAMVMASMGRIDIARDSLQTALKVSGKIKGKNSHVMTRQLNARINEELRLIAGVDRPVFTASTAQGGR